MRLRIHSSVSKIILILIVAATDSLAYSDTYLDDASISVAEHNKRSSNVAFPADSSSDPSSQWGLMFTNPPTEFEAHGTISFKALPVCGNSGVELREVHHHTPFSEQFDVLYYDGSSSKQLERAKRYSRAVTVAYNPALVRDPKTLQLDRWQVFARFIQVKCLPSRFHFKYIGSKRYIEFRTGEKAWTE